MSGLSTHVLDTSKGIPAEGIEIELYKFDDDMKASLLTRAITNSDGRTDLPLLDEVSISPGKYQLKFMVEDYLKRQNQSNQDAFFFCIPINFIINDLSKHYHVPLLISPYGYSTYRGS